MRQSSSRFHPHGGRRFAFGEFGRGGRERGPHGGEAERRHEHGHGHDRGHGPGRRGGRPGRLFDHGELRLVVLALIAERPRHGYEVIKEIEDRSGGSYGPSPGVIYPNLTMLEELGHATVTEAGGRKLYAITAEGQAALAVRAGPVESAMVRLREAGRARAGGRAPEILRATENLKLALSLRQERGPLDEEQVRRVAAALDAAAVAIERS